MASVASLAGTGLFVGAVALLVVSAERPGLRAIAVILIAIELVAFLRSPLRFAERMSTHRLGFDAVARWREWLTLSVGRWSYSRWQRHATGDLLERALTDTDELQDLWLRAVVPSVAAIVTMVAGDVVVALLAPTGHWWVVGVATAMVQAGCVAVIGGRLAAQVRADRTLRARRGDYVASLVAARAAAPEIERLGRGSYLQRRDDRAVAALTQAEDLARRARGRDVAIVAVGPLAALAVVALARPSSAPVWVVTAALVGVATFDALIVLRSAVHTAVAVTGGAERLDEVAVTTPSTTTTWPRDVTLAFRDVSLSATSNQPRRVQGRVTPGRRVGVTGPSGAGKSTLLRSLAGLDDANGAAVTIGTTPIADIDEDELRTHVVLVPSEPGLVRGYVRDVVGMGVTPGDDEIDNLARVGIVVGLNDQWDDLSRGERQRVALVRALARTPDILLLDEPTSALGETETRALLALLAALPTSVVIASHDPRVLAWCDEVIDLGASSTS